MKREIFPWNSWIRSGDEISLYDGVRKAVNGSQFFRGKSVADLCSDYGTDIRDDVVQEVALRVFKRLPTYIGKSDEDIAIDIRTITKRLIIDIFRKRKVKNTENLNDDTVEDFSPRHSLDTKPSPAKELERKQLITLIRSHLRPRLEFVLEHYNAFGIGFMSGEEIAFHLNVSVKSVDVYVAEIRRIAHRVMIESGYLQPTERPRTKIKGMRVQK